MKELFEGLTAYAVTQYNTDVGSAVLTVGVNAVAGAVLPETPDFCIGLIHDTAARDPHSPIHRPEFMLVVRTPVRDSGSAMSVTEGLVTILGRASNAVPSYPCLVRAISEPGLTGTDTKQRIIMITKFVVWTVSL